MQSASNLLCQEHFRGLTCPSPGAEHAGTWLRPSAVTGNPFLASLGGWSYTAWPRCRGALSAGAAFCAKPVPGQQVPAWELWALVPAGLGGDTLPILYKFGPALMSQTVSSQGSFVFPQVTRGCFHACVGIHRPEQNAGQPLWLKPQHNRRVPPAPSPSHPARASG